MHECGTVPVEKIMENEHKQDGVCCLISEVTEAPPRADCPESVTISRKIQHRTIERMVKPELVDKILASQYYYCAASACPIVYFSQDGTSKFTTEDLLVAVFAKDPGKDVYVCYCYDWTRSRIENEIRETGVSTASRKVAEKVRASLCECDIKNPKGTCCLGDISAYVREAKDNLKAEK